MRFAVLRASLSLAFVLSVCAAAASKSELDAFVRELCGEGSVLSVDFADCIDPDNVLAKAVALSMSDALVTAAIINNGDPFLRLEESSLSPFEMMLKAGPKLYPLALKQALLVADKRSWKYVNDSVIVALIEGMQHGWVARLYDSGFVRGG